MLRLTNQDETTIRQAQAQKDAGLGRSFLLDIAGSRPFGETVTVGSAPAHARSELRACSNTQAQPIGRIGFQEDKTWD